MNERELKRELEALEGKGEDKDINVGNIIALLMPVITLAWIFL